MKFSKKDNENLERQSLINLVNFYQDELLEVAKGNSIFHILPHLVRKQLVKGRIIHKGYNFYKLGSVYKLTIKGKEMLGIE